MSALKEPYQKVAAELSKEWGKNLLEVPRLDKIVVNVGIGSQKDDKSYKDFVVESLTAITGQKPIVRQARLSIAGFKLREGMDVGVKVTLRGERMEDFFYRLVHVVLPRVRDFRGLSPRAFDGQGNYTLGLTEHTVFPEISADDVTRTHPLEITIVTSSSSDDDARELFTRLGFPFIGKDGNRG
jgi:large subunit ribosomal protein L5